MEKIVRVGVGVVVKNKEGKILLGKRKNAHGAHQWAPPGGHLEFGETPVACAARELEEETGMTLLNAQQTVVTNDIFEVENKHYITLFVEGTCNDQPQLLEPHKCEQWKWFDLDEFPQELFLSLKNYLSLQES